MKDNIAISLGCSSLAERILSRRTFLKTGVCAFFSGKVRLPGVQNFTACPTLGSFPSRIWHSTPPEQCPIPASSAFSGLRLLGRYARYANADTWFPTWASNGNLYSPFADGGVGDVRSACFGKDARTGQAVIVGDDPLDLQIVEPRTYAGDPTPFGGRYPCGSLVHNGFWYYGTYCLDDNEGSHAIGLNWDTLGPFVGFRISGDMGKTWREAPYTPSNPIFGESGKSGSTVRFGAPHFVDFGRNMEHSPDGKAYLVAHGSQAPDPYPRPANASWITGDQIYLARVTPTPHSINDPGGYEFFAGLDDGGRPRWTNSFTEMRPLIDWNNNCGCVTITYLANLKKYLMCVTDGQTTVSSYNTYILESDALTGPWKMVTYMRDFGEQGYFVNIPSKFVTPNGASMWLCYSANFTNNTGLRTHYQSDPPGGGYGMTLQEIELLRE